MIRYYHLFRRWATDSLVYDRQNKKKAMENNLLKPQSVTCNRKNKNL